MSNSLSGAVAVTHPGPSGLVAADPSALAQLAAQFQQRASGVRSGTPALLSAWQQTAAVLTAQHTGAILAAAWQGSRAALDECAGAVEALARALHRSEGSYASAEASAVPSPPAA